MTKHNFTQNEIFSSAWAKVKSHAWYLFTVLFIVLALMSAVAHNNPLVEIITGLAVGIALTTISLVIAHGNHPTYHDLIKSFKNQKISINYTLASIVYILILLVGVGGGIAILSILAASTMYGGMTTSATLVAIIATIAILTSLYYAIRFQFYKFIIVEDENMLPLEALKKSMKLTEGAFWKLVLFIIVIIVMNVIAAIPFGLGLIVTVPLTMIAYAVLYRKLAEHA